MKYAGYMPNDFLNGKGICVSLWVSGCPFHCKGCHNQQMQDYNYGEQIPENLYQKLDRAIVDNGIQRNFSVLGGEPLCKQNRQFVNKVITHIKSTFPAIQIFCWTGYTIEQLRQQNDKDINSILNQINVLIDGRFILEQRDVTLELRGSPNQRIIYLNKGEDN